MVTALRESSKLDSTELDLATVAQTQRAATWRRSAITFFPGLSVKKTPVNPVAGRIHGEPLGPGYLWSILSPDVLVSYFPTSQPGAEPIFSVMLQLEGSTRAAQCGRVCILHPGDFCVIDGLASFDLEVSESLSRVVFLQMPRHAVLSRKAGLEGRTAQAFDADEPGALLLRNLLTTLVDTVPFLEAEQRAAAFASVMQMVAAPKLPGGEVGHGRNGERIAATLAFIDAQLADPTLTAQRVAAAQRLSRRRLDQIMAGMGTSLTAQIWSRRLTQAASDLVDPRFAAKTVTQIAFGVGFEDAAHFARAFKRRYQCTPREWRSGSPQRGRS
jgi:AraC family transcriptional regulator, positive regulator of tynA and feaB